MTIRKMLTTLLTATAICLAADGAFAQRGKAEKKEPTPEEKKGYTLPYFFSGVAVLIVIIPLCWPAGRRVELPVQED